MAMTRVRVFFTRVLFRQIFGEFKPSGEGTSMITVRSGSFREFIADKGVPPSVETMEDVPVIAGRTFVEYVGRGKG